YRNDRIRHCHILVCHPVLRIRTAPVQSKGFPYSPARNTAHPVPGLSSSSPLIHSNCGCKLKNFSATNGIPHADPHRAANDIFFAIAPSTALPSTVPLQSKGTPLPLASGSRSKCPHNVLPPGNTFPRYASKWSASN